MTLRTLNYGNYGIFLIMGNAGFCPSTVWVWLYTWGLVDADGQLNPLQPQASYATPLPRGSKVVPFWDYLIEF